MAIREKVPVRLREEERRTLQRITRTGRHPSAMLRRAQILLKSDADGPDHWIRGGVANMFMAFEPLAGWRHVEVTQRKTSIDFAQLLRALSDQYYPHAQRLVLVCDNLSTHTPAALYEAFTPQEAMRLTKRFEWHYTPEHGS